MLGQAHVNLTENILCPSRPRLRKLARLVTHVTAPPVLAIPGYYLLGSIAQERYPIAGGFTMVLAMAFFFGVIAPIGLVVILKMLNLIGDIHIGRQSQRTLPFTLCILSFSLGTLVMWNSFGWHLLTALLGCYAVNTLLVMLINFKWKISVHAAGIGGPIAAFFLAVGWSVLPFMMLLLSVVCWARVHLKAHSVSQVLAGSTLGFATTLLLFGFFQVPL
ncbi:MAG: hypothetical protein JWP00_3333 [Chloroflexi bacterium]|jgi:membrane-associated phospholipid phosphatase|nr:hypothetical protein [Chloroflexota bacterium]